MSFLLLVLAGGAVAFGLLGVSGMKELWLSLIN
jgi:hypothetical protein